jgi:Succinate dehydrogenase/Fumarate reductase transmembrane subunit
LFGWSVAFFYHLCSGIRHLAWDAGYGFDIRDAYRTGYAVLARMTFVLGLKVRSINRSTDQLICAATAFLQMRNLMTASPIDTAQTCKPLAAGSR